MNDSNNLFNNNNVTSTQQPVNTNGVNLTPQPDNSAINMNLSVDNNVFGDNPASTQENFNTQTNNTIPTPQPENNNILPQQNPSSSNSLNDDDLLRAFIGNNYEKITTRPFNIAAFFFNSLYMCYRKMFGYGVLAFLIFLIIFNVFYTITPVLSFILSLGLWIIIGLYTNKLYLSFAKKKIAIIKATNPQKSNEELKSICATKGGTSVGKIFLGLLAQFGVALVVLFIMALVGIGSFMGDFFSSNNQNETGNNGSETNDNYGSSSTNGTLLENVSVNGYSCMGSKCNVTIETDDENSEDYVLGIRNSDFFNELGDYKDYIKLNIYYNKKGSNKTIVGYKIYLKQTNEDISSVSNEDELREKIGLYSLGTHTETMTLKEIGTTGFGFVDEESYTYTEYTFVDSKNIEYVMKYKNDDGSSNLTEGKQYSVTFEVVEGIMDYDYMIKNVK